jgi:hypothetical protein
MKHTCHRRALSLHSVSTWRVIVICPYLSGMMWSFARSRRSDNRRQPSRGDGNNNRFARGSKSCKWKLSHNLKRVYWFARRRRRIALTPADWTCYDSYYCFCYRSLYLVWPVINYSHSSSFLLIAVRTSGIKLQVMTVKWMLDLNLYLE